MGVVYGVEDSPISISNPIFLFAPDQFFAFKGAGIFFKGREDHFYFLQILSWDRLLLFGDYATGHYTLEDLKKASFAWGLVSRKGNPIVKAELYRTLTRPFYYGLMKYTGEWHQGTHEPLISKDLFDQVQKALVRNGKPNKYKKQKFELLGLASCSSCGCPI